MLILVKEMYECLLEALFAFFIVKMHVQKYCSRNLNQ